MVAAIIASLIGSSEEATKLLISLLIGYPLAFLYRSPLVYNRSPIAKHTFFSVIGIAICYYNFGMNTAHLLFNVTVIYLLLRVCGGSKFSVIFALIFNTGYLIFGYYDKMTHGYTMSWTLPQCVITLRLTGVVFDYFDGQKKDIPKDLEESALTDKPGYLEMMGHVFFFGGVMVGPQFPLKRYLNFVEGVYVNQQTGSPPDSILPGFKRLVLGVAYIIMFQVVGLYIPNSYFQSTDFFHKGFLYKCTLIAIWGKHSLSKYIGVWLVSEGSIILTGLSYNGFDDAKVVRWDACKNVSVWNLETAESFADYVKAFNINTHNWMSKYIFKRLKFFGNKTLSQLVTLFYLALWHGLEGGYYMCFFLELLQTQAETQLLSVCKRCQAAKYLPSGTLWMLLGRAARKFILVFMGSYALLAFVLLDYNKWFKVHQSVYFLGLLLPLLVIISCTTLNVLVKVKPHDTRMHNGNGELAKKDL